MKKNTRSIPARRSAPKWIFLLLVIAGAILLLLLKKPGLDKEKTAPESQSPKTLPRNNAPDLVPPQQPSLLSDQNSVTPRESIIQPPAPETPPKPSTCPQVAAELNTLFTHLDQQKYVQAYTQNSPVQTVLTQIFAKLLDNPPVNTDETSDLLSVIRNSSHLYRVLGRKDLSLLKEIIKNEHPSIEKHLATLALWSTMDKSCQESTGIAIDLPVTKTYQYAAFFLNTLGGQSYLSRRDPTLRALAKYYCVLILDKATVHSLDTYKINLTYQIDSAMADLAETDSLENQTSYLDTLSSIKNKPRNK